MRCKAFTGVGNCLNDNAKPYKYTFSGYTFSGETRISCFCNQCANQMKKYVFLEPLTNEEEIIYHVMVS